MLLNDDFETLNVSKAQVGNVIMWCNQCDTEYVLELITSISPFNSSNTLLKIGLINQHLKQHTQVFNVYDTFIYVRML